MAGRTTRPDDWSTAVLNPASPLYPFLVYVATPLNGGIEYNNGLTGGSATVVKGVYPDQYGYAEFTFDPNLYQDGNNFDFTLIIMVNDEGGSPGNDEAAAQYEFISSVDSRGWAYYRLNATTVRFQIFNNNLRNITFADTEVLDRAHTDIFVWNGANSTLSLRYVYWDQDDASSTVQSPAPCPSMQIAPVATPFKVGSATQPVQLAIVLKGVNPTQLQKQAVFDNIWDIFLEPGVSHNLTAEDLTYTHTLPDVTLEVIDQLVIEDAVYTHTMDEPLLGHPHILTAEDVVYTHTMDEPSLASPVNLAISDLMYTHTMDEPSLGLSGLCAEDIVHTQDMGVFLNAKGAGTPVVEVNYTEINDTFEIRSTGLTQSLAQQILDFAEANSHNTIPYEWEGRTYTTIVSEEPVMNMLPGGDWEVVLTLDKVRDVDTEPPGPVPADTNVFDYFSPAMNETVEMVTYVPQVPVRAVIYFLHGNDQDISSIQYANKNIPYLDAAIAAGHIEPVMAIFPSDGAINTWLNAGVVEMVNVELRAFEPPGVICRGINGMSAGAGAALRYAFSPEFRADYQAIAPAAAGDSSRTYSLNNPRNDGHMYYCHGILDPTTPIDEATFNNFIAAHAATMTECTGDLSMTCAHDYECLMDQFNTLMFQMFQRAIDLAAQP